MPNRRQVGRLRRLYLARAAAERKVQAAAGRQLGRAWRRVYGSVRTLRKADGYDGAWWTEWSKDFEAALLEAMVSSAADVGAVEAAWFGDLAMRAGQGANVAEVYFDPATIVAQHQAEIGRLITDAADTTREEVAARVADWANNPDVSLNDLIDNLGGLFGDARAKLIATTEVTALSSTITADLMRQTGIDSWKWWSLLDGKVCTNCMSLHGRDFTLRDPMPPDASHPGCRCAATPNL
jgi:SPP1 gp7 family putative phage head morphogenesis protein